MSPTPSSTTPAETPGERVDRLVADALRGLKFGTVTVTVHDGAVTTIERLERTRLAPTK